MHTALTWLLPFAFLLAEDPLPAAAAAVVLAVAGDALRSSIAFSAAVRASASSLSFSDDKQAVLTMQVEANNCGTQANK